MTTANNRPKRFVTTWAEADNSKKVEIPETAELAKQEHEARASMEMGFPEITMKSAMRGGVPPWGTDHNGILHRITSALQWIQSGGTAIFDQVLSDKIGGYPCGAILQDDNEPQILWFSKIDNNGNNPSNTQSPANGWVKTDFADLEKRLKAAEDTIVNHEGRLNTVENNISDIYNNKLPAKADKEGSCGINFHANIMQAGEYRFCNSPNDGNGYITQNNKNMNLYGDEYINLCFPDFNNNNKDNFSRESVIALQYEKDLGITSANFFASNTLFKGGWVHIQNTVLSIENTLIQISANTTDSQNKLQYTTWQVGTTVYGSEQGAGDLVLQLFSTGISKAEDRLRISYLNGDVTAIGSFITQPSDLAEYYQGDRSDYEPGTLMCHGTNREVTLCNSSDQNNDFFGVISTRPAYIMNAGIKDDPNAVLIALNGKVPVKVKGVVKCGDKITVGQDGYGVVSKDKNDVIVGRAKEDKITEEVGLVSCYVQARL